MGDEIIEPMAQTVLFNIYSPQLILLGLFLVAIRSVYTDYVVPFLLSAMVSRSEDEQDYDRLAAEYERLRVEAAKVNSPDTFAQYSLIRRKMLSLKRQIDVIEPRVRASKATAGIPARVLRDVVPIAVLLIAVFLARSHQLFAVVNTNPDRPYGCFASIGTLFGLSAPLDERLASLSEAALFCSPLSFLLRDGIGLLIWTIIISRAAAFGTSAIKQLRQSK